MLLEIKNLNVSFENDRGKLIAVNNISFSLNSGETLGIVGESGSGKSVTCLSIMQLLQNATVNGEVLFNPSNDLQVNLCSIPSNQMRKYRGNDIAMIFQEPMTFIESGFFLWLTRSLKLTLL